MNKIVIPVHFESIYDIANCGVMSVQVPVMKGTSIFRRMIEKKGDRLRVKDFDHILLKSAKNSRLSFNPEYSQLIVIDGHYLINIYVREVVRTKIREEYVDEGDWMTEWRRKKGYPARS